MVLTKNHILLCAAYILTLNGQSAFAKPIDASSSSSSSSGSGSQTQESEIVAFSLDNLNLIEAALIDDGLLLKRSNGKIDKLSVKALNRAAKDQSRTLWNLYCFYIVKDVWRSLRHQEKLLGQANFTLEVRNDGTYTVKRHALYVPGCHPCIENEPAPKKAQEFWQQITESIASIELKLMTIPDRKVNSVSLEIVAGRDLKLFPRHPFFKYKGMLVRDKTGKTNRAPTQNSKH